jgi:hypothetical protein
MENSLLKNVLEGSLKIFADIVVIISILLPTVPNYKQQDSIV